MSVKSIRSDAEEFLEGLSWILLVPIVVSVIYVFGLSLGAAGVDEILHSGLLTGIELTIIPLSAIAAAWLRPGADRIRALRETRAGPYLPLLMAGTLVGLIAYLVWSWLLPQASFGPDGFGYARWAGTALAAAFTIFWLPLFPGLTAILAGMIAGPALFAGLGYLFFESFLTMPAVVVHDACWGAFFYTLLALEIGLLLLVHSLKWVNLGIAGFIASLIASYFFLPNAFLTITFLLLLLGLLLSVLLLLTWALGDIEPRLQRPLKCAVVSGVLALGLAVLGAHFKSGCLDPGAF